MWGITPLDQMICRIRFRKTRYEGRYTPPNTDYSLVYPGLTGTMNWGGLSIDEDRQIAIANITMIPWRVRLVPRKQVSAAVANARWTPLMIGTPYAWEQEPFLGPLAVPCNQPPWGRLTAVDLRSGRTLWSRPLGTARDSGPLGLGFGPPIPVGVPNVGGAVTTRGDVTFIAGTMDQYIRAFDTRNGAELWKARLPAGGQATPMTYMAAGRQYLVVSAGGHAILGTRKGDVTLAFALPKPEAEQKSISKEGE
jgi:quinoprotein glucose dehydrogenase